MDNNSSNESEENNISQKKAELEFIIDNIKSSPISRNNIYYSLQNNAQDMEHFQINDKEQIRFLFHLFVEELSFEEYMRQSEIARNIRNVEFDSEKEPETIFQPLPYKQFP